VRACVCWALDDCRRPHEHVCGARTSVGIAGATDGESVGVCEGSTVGESVGVTVAPCVRAHACVREFVRFPWGHSS
jgi:hypothetical protein